MKLILKILKHFFIVVYFLRLTLDPRNLAKLLFKKIRHTLISIWNLNNFQHKLDHIIRNFEQYFEIANYANSLYNSYLHDKEYLEDFCIRLKNIFHN